MQRNDRGVIAQTYHDLQSLSDLKTARGNAAQTTLDAIRIVDREAANEVEAWALRSLIALCDSANRSTLGFSRRRDGARSAPGCTRATPRSRRRA